MHTTKIITSITNPLIKNIAHVQTKKGREALGLFCAEGIRTIKTLIASEKMELVHLITNEYNERDARELAPYHELVVVSEAVMKKISSSSSPSGIIAVFAIPTQKLPLQVNFGVILAQIHDPGNMGTLIRTAAALDKKTVICIEGTDPWSPKVVQASAGTIGLVDIIECSWNELLQAKEGNLCALVVRGGISPENITQKNVLLVIGSESHGLPQAWVDDCELKMTIPMPGGTESLNAAVAGSIALYLMQ